MFRRKARILLLICLFLLFIEQGIAAETYPSQRDGVFVIAGQVTGGPARAKYWYSSLWDSSSIC